MLIWERSSWRGGAPNNHSQFATFATNESDCDIVQSTTTRRGSRSPPVENLEQLVSVKLRSRIFLILALLLLLTFLASQWRRAHLESNQDKNILGASQKYGVDPALVKAVIWRESRFNPSARGTKGEIGLMQIMEVTGHDWAGARRVPVFSDFTLRDPAQNIDCGSWYLSKLLRRYPATDNPLPYALADYNAGRGNVLKWMKGDATTNSTAFMDAIGFPSTRQYVRDVMDRRLKYERQFGNRAK